MIDSQMSKILEEVRTFPLELEKLKEIVLANLVLIGEIPAPTGEEQQRISFVMERMVEYGVEMCATDELGNGLAFLPGRKGKQTILIVAHADTPFPANVDHTFSVNSTEVHGPGVADNSLGVAVLTSLPFLLDKLKIQLESNLLLLTSVRNLNQGNQEGLKFFLANSKQPIDVGIVLEGAPLGRLNFKSIASLGGLVSCQINRRISQESAIKILCQVISSLNSIPLPQETHTFLTLGAIQAGVSYKYPARHGRLQFQVRSSSDDTIKEITGIIYNLLDNISQQPGVSAHFRQIASSKCGGVDSNHPLVLCARKIHEVLKITPQDSIYSPAVSAFVEHKIPALCIGLTEAENVNYEDEFIEIEPLIVGIAQLIGILMAIDGGRQCKTSTRG
ncbi:Acetylornithine deacetylase/Succinyl-diaminopimelate desuccinylase [Desulfonauticus submarinus]|uniref:Acetylornithine deacetylase/Succinyl-diaminopimelate desuccinylase n=1 Tax=Desulfonauticus submarinus TaxID=206665 RepID=A0A1H0DU65_9BACT|nr:hypothetical protein [Desulfonauticus submarinus]SDN73573.1 Acetylornithine deacetylase/Succinyl-diaminopimelate desuccinylase [Desulfonauticus submarinus]